MCLPPRLFLFNGCHSHPSPISTEEHNTVLCGRTLSCFVRGVQETSFVDEWFSGHRKGRVTEVLTSRVVFVATILLCSQSSYSAGERMRSTRGSTSSKGLNWVVGAWIPALLMLCSFPQAGAHLTENGEALRKELLSFVNIDIIAASKEAKAAATQTPALKYVAELKNDAIEGIEKGEKKYKRIAYLLTLDKTMLNNELGGMLERVRKAMLEVGDPEKVGLFWVRSKVRPLMTAGYLIGVGKEKSVEKVVEKKKLKEVMMSAMEKMTKTKGSSSSRRRLVEDSSVRDVVEDSFVRDVVADKVWEEQRVFGGMDKKGHVIVYSAIATSQNANGVWTGIHVLNYLTTDLSTDSSKVEILENELHTKFGVTVLV